MKIRLSILVFFLLVSSKMLGQKNDERFADLAQKVDSIANNSIFNGVISISIDSVDIYRGIKGYADIENRIFIDFFDQFVIGSISKQITAVLILREYEKGKIHLEDRISKYLQEIDQPWSERITLHQLLTHTHGIIDLDKPLQFEEGTQFHYSQLGYELLAQVLQKITGKTFENLSSELFAEYGLYNTWHPAIHKYEHLVRGYEENKNGDLIFATNSLDNYVAAGGFISNATDLKKWNELLYSGKLVDRQTLKLMSTKYATRIHPVFDTINYGYGILFREGQEYIEIGALGYTPGFVSACYFYPKTGISLIVLSNTARYLDYFKMTFEIHTQIMKVVKEKSTGY